MQPKQVGDKLTVQPRQTWANLASGIRWAREVLSRKAALQLRAAPMGGYTPIFGDLLQIMRFELSSVTQTKQ